MEITFVFLFLLSKLCLGLILWLYSWFTFWRRQGVPGPRFIDFGQFFVPTHEHNLLMARKYGKVYGTYGITNRMLIINDPELIKEVWRNFDIFQDRFFYYVGRNPKVTRVLSLAPGDHNWKRIRHSLGPFFGTLRLPAVMSKVSDISDRLVDSLADKFSSGQFFNIIAYTDCYVMDVIQSCVHGKDLDSYSEPGNPLVVRAKALLSRNVNYRQFLAVLVPPLARLLNKELFPEEELLFFGNIVNEMVSKRTDDYNKNSNEISDNKQKNFIDLLVSLKMGRNRRETLSTDEIIASGISFWMAGFDPTTVTIAFAVYYLSVEKECQQRVYEELRYVDEFTYERVDKLEYLSAVIDETLRLSPILLTTPRVCAQDYELRGIKIPAGTSVGFNPYVLHRDPDYWEEPEKFNPQRFIKDEDQDQENDQDNVGKKVNHAYAYGPFGFGKRRCIGERFALGAIKMCLAKIIRRFEVSLKPGYKVEYFRCSLTHMPKEILVSLTPKW